MYLTCFDLNPFLFRTLAQRAAKRAKAPVIVIEDDPTVSAGGVSETTLTDPATTPQSSPQRSPQRKFIVYFLLRCGSALFSLLISCMLDLCRSRTASPGMPGSCSRSAICFDACVKVRRPADGERVDVEWSLLKPSGVVSDERERAKTDLAALHQSSDRNHDQGDRKKSQLLKLGAKTPSVGNMP